MEYETVLNNLIDKTRDYESKAHKLADRYRHLVGKLFGLTGSAPKPSELPSRGSWYLMTDSGYVAKSPKGVGVLDSEALNIIDRDDLALLRNATPSMPDKCYVSLLWVMLTPDGYYVYYGNGLDRPSIDGMSLIIAHHAQYDRSTCQFNPKTAWLCTMSLAIRLHGVGNKQPQNFSASLKALALRFLDREIDKGVRDKLINPEGQKTTDGEIGLDGDVLPYCVSDVDTTLDLLAVFMGQWRPHSYSLLGHLAMSREFMVIKDDYKEWVKRTDDLVEGYKIAASEHILESLANLSESDIEATGLKPSQIKAYKANKGIFSIVATLALNPTINIEGTEYPLKAVPNHTRKGDYKCLGYYDNNGIPVILYSDTNSPSTSLFHKTSSYLLDTDLVTLNVPDTFKKTILSCAFWSSYHKRLDEVLVTCQDSELGKIYIPQFVNHKTVTGRKADALVCTAPGTKPLVAGSEMRFNWVAPKGYKIVGIDFDQQEAVLAALVASQLTVTKGVTSNKASQVILFGDKTKKTDIHSLAADCLDCTRDQAKAFVYAALYGQGKKGCIEGLAKIKPNLKSGELDILYRRFTEMMKGKAGVFTLAFKALDNISSGLHRYTPVLGSPMTTSLSRTQKYTTTRNNWVVQGSGRDGLDILQSLLCILLQPIGGLLYFSVHDSCSFVVPTDTPEAVIKEIVALAHAMTWIQTITYLKLDLQTTPEKLLLPSSIDVDYIWRKSPSDNCVSVSNSQAYAPGQSLKVTRDDLVRGMTNH